MYTLYKFHFLNGISEINQLFDDILIIWPAAVYVCVTSHATFTHKKNKNKDKLKKKKKKLSSLPSEIFKTSHSWISLTVACLWTSGISILNESMLLNESVEWMNQLLTQNSWPNQCCWMNRLSEWINDSLKIPDRISVVEWIGWFNGSIVKAITAEQLNEIPHN